MAYTETWDEAYEARPVAEINDINDGDDEAADLKVNIRERFQTLERNMSCDDHLLTNAVLKNVTKKIHAHGSVSGAVSVSFEDGVIHTMTLAGDTTITIEDPPESGACGIISIMTTQDGTGNRAVTVTGAVYPNGVNTTCLFADAIAVMTFITIDGGATWYAAYTDGGW